MAPTIYDETIELYSLHGHLHLPQQVLNHGGLSHTSAFCFESSIRYLKEKAHGTKSLGTQISDWIQTESALSKPKGNFSASLCFNKIGLNDPILNDFRLHLTKLMETFNVIQNEVSLFLRFMNENMMYNTFLYDKTLNCSSHSISFKINSIIYYGRIIIFLQINQQYYGIVNQYSTAGKDMSDSLSLRNEFKSKLNELFLIRRRSNKFILLPVIDFYHKCIEVVINDDIYLSEIRTDYEYD